MLPLSLLAIIENSLNRYVNMATNGEEKLAKLAGHTLGISISGMPIEIYMMFHHDHIYLQQHCLGQADLFIKAPPFALLELLKTDHAQRILQQKNIELQGDVMLAQKLKSFFQELDIDWAYYLSLLTGEVIAQQSTSLITNGLQRLKKLSSDLKFNIGEYLQEEIRVTPHQNALDCFYEEVDQLRTASDLLEARIAKLTQELKNR